MMPAMDQDLSQPESQAVVPSRTTYGVLATAWRPSVSPKLCSDEGLKAASDAFGKAVFHKMRADRAPFNPAVMPNYAGAYLAHRERLIKLVADIEALIKHQLHDSAKYTYAREVRRESLLKLVEGAA